MIQGTFLRRVTYRHTIEYEVVNAPNLFDPENPALLSVGRTGNTRRFVVMDENVERHASAAIRDYFSKNGIEARIVTLPGGEAFKSLDSYLTITRELDAFPIHRRDEPIIAIGGGVLTDVVGFVASTYRRGLPSYQRAYDPHWLCGCSHWRQDRRQLQQPQEPHRCLRPAAESPARQDLPEDPPPPPHS